MPKEWILNSAMNRFQLNFKRNVGPTSKSIRECSPKSLDEWRKYYYKNIKSKEHIDKLGKILFEKIKQIIKEEVEDITEEDCLNYMHNIVTNRTFDGYTSEIAMIKENLEKVLEVRIEEAPDEWDRLLNVDFFIKIKDKFVGLQIKPTGPDVMHQIIKEKNQQKKTHEEFTKKYGGKVFYIYSEKKDGKKILKNPEVIEEIKKEIERLSNL